MKQLLTINLTTRTTDWTPPVLTFGESITLQIRFLKTIKGKDVEPNLTISQAKASVGNVDARPGGGTFALQFGADPSTADNTTDPIGHDATPAQVAAAINAKTVVTGIYGTATAKKVNGSWLLRFGSGAAQVPFKVVKNELWPVCFGIVNAGQLQDNLWVHELRLTQAPVAFVGGDPDLQLPGVPSFSVLIHGGSSGGGLVWDTVQQLYVPPDFRGTYRIVKDNVRSALLDEGASADAIQAALISALGAGIAVTLPFSYRFQVNLGGSFAGTDVAALSVEGGDPPASDLFLTIPFDRLELALLLDAEPTVTLPLEIRLTCTEDGGDAQEIVALVVPVTIQQSLAKPIMDTLQTIDWLRYPSPKTYLGPETNTVLTGEKIKAVPAGDGAATTFVVTHTFATADVQVFVRLAGAPGTQLIDGTNFTATVDSTSQVTVTAIGGAPALNAWRITIIAAVAIATWANDLTLAQNQVTGLEARLEADEAAITALQALIPSNASLPSGVAAAGSFTIQLPAASEILFARDKTTGLPITDPTKLPTRPAFMLPALDTTTVIGALPTSPLPAPGAGNLYTTAAATLIPGGGHIRGSNSTASGYVGSDGRMLYPVTKSGSKDSYFPTPFERVLFEVMINDMMFSGGTTLTLLFKLALQLIDANSEAQWMLAIEQGLITADTSPGTPDANLADVTWQTATPLVLQKLNLSSALETAGFGCIIANSGGTTFTATGLVYKRMLSATANVQQTANFALRARLFNFDTRNSVPDARGWVSWALQQPDNGNVLGVSIS